MKFCKWVLFALLLAPVAMFEVDGAGVHLPSAQAAGYELSWYYGTDTSGFDVSVGKGWVPVQLSAGYDTQRNAGIWVVWKTTPTAAEKGAYNVRWMYGTDTSAFDTAVNVGEIPVLSSAGTDTSGNAGLWVVTRK